MEMEKLNPSSLCIFFMTILFLGMVFGNLSKDNLRNEIISKTISFKAQPPLSNVQNDTDTSIQALTESILLQRTGRRINFQKLLQEYTLICPLEDTCGIDIDRKFLFHGDVKTINPECTKCTCGQDCIGNKRTPCCPSNYHGYIDFECVNTTLLNPLSWVPKTHKLYFMITNCPEGNQGNITIVELCSSTINPCTSVTSGLIYKNKYCGICNKENECNSWSLQVECDSKDQQNEGFQKVLSSITSLSEMYTILRDSECEIYFERPRNTSVAYICSDSNVKAERYVDSCNVTGLWDKYNADIEWACENFYFPYMEFKNVFCYICNPSIANIQNVALIDSCRNSTILTHTDVHEACESMPTAARLKPYKNIYCYACNKGHLLHTTSDYDIVNVSEKNNIFKYGTELSFKVSVRSGNKIQSIKNFLRDALYNFSNVQFGKTIKKMDEPVRKFFDFNKLKKNYISICGTKTICNTSAYHTNKTYGNPTCGHCYCGSKCAEQEDCCPEFIFQEKPYSCLDPHVLPSLGKLSSLKPDVPYEHTLPSYVPGSSFKVIDKCLGKEIDNDLLEKCSSLEEQSSDILDSIPVTMLSGISYKNAYCYVCNNNRSDIVVKVAFQVLCDAYIEHKLFTKLFTLLEVVNTYCNKVSFVPINSTLCKKKYDSFQAGLIGGERFVRTQVHPALLVERKIKTVSVNVNDLNDTVKSVFSACNQTGHMKDEDELLNYACASEDENILSLSEYRIEDRVYKNFACFLCNPDVTVTESDVPSIMSSCLVNNSVEWYEHNEVLEELCNITEFYLRWFPYKNMYCSECNLPPWQLVDVQIAIWHVLAPHSRYTYIFSLSHDDFERMVEEPKLEKIPQCSSGTFDHSVRQCRLLYCKGGFQLFNNTCVPVLKSASNLQYEINFKLRYLFGQLNSNSSNNERNTSIIIDLNDLCSRVFDIISESFPETTVYTVYKECYPNVVNTAESYTEYRVPPQNETYMYYDITTTGPIHVHIVIKIMYTDKIAMVQGALVKAQTKVYEIRNISDMQGIAWSIDFISESDERKLNVFADTNILGSKTVNPYTTVVDKFYICPQVKFNSSKTYLNMETSELFIKENNLTFTFDEYTISERSVAICLEDFDRKVKLTPSIQAHVCAKTLNLESVFSVFDLVCSLVSMGCLLMTIVTYSLFSNLRTLPGQNIMTLCIFLFCSQGFLQFGLDVSKGTTLCKIVGVCIHYFWLASFCAMNICSFHTFFVFVFKEILNRPPGRSLLVKYLIYIISLPLVCVLISVLVNITNGSKLGYGENVCFISDFYVFVGTFLIPSCVIFVSNIVFFATAFHKIRTTRRVQSTHERNNFCICLKLCAIVGVTWPLLILDNIVQLTWFSFIVSGVNSLQGVFIFISFVFNGKVKTFYSNLFRKKAAKSAVKTTTSTNITSIEVNE